MQLSNRMRSARWLGDYHVLIMTDRCLTCLQAVSRLPHNDPREWAIIIPLFMGCQITCPNNTAKRRPSRNSHFGLWWECKVFTATWIPPCGDTRSLPTHPVVGVPQLGSSSSPTFPFHPHRFRPHHLLTDFPAPSVCLLHDHQHLLKPSSPHPSPVLQRGPSH